MYVKEKHMSAKRLCSPVQAFGLDFDTGRSGAREGGREGEEIQGCATTHFVLYPLFYLSPKHL